jgi:PAS domain S-box-containing protein
MGNFMETNCIYLLGTLAVALGMSWLFFGLRLRWSRRTTRAAEGKTSAILDAAVDGVITIDENGIVEAYNKAAERIFGYSPSEVIGHNLHMLMPEPYHSDHDGYLAAYKATGRAKIIGIGREVTGRRKDGSTFPMDLAVGESRNAGKRVFAGIVRDITARKQMDQQLRDSEARTRAILETAVDGIITINPMGTVLTVNPAAERIFGYSAQEVVGQNIKMLMPEPYHTAHDGYLEGYRTTGQRKIIGIGREVEGRRKDGSTFPLELSVGEAVAAGSRIFAGIVRDISERKRTEEELRQSEERFRLIVDNVRDYAIIWLDLEGRIVSWNEGAGRLYGWSAEEAIGKAGDMFYPADHKEEATAALRAVRESGRYEGEGWRIRKDGSHFWAHAVITPFWDATGAMRGFVRVSRDITERKRSDEALRAAKEEAERANLAKSKFLASASHDLRQPVQALVFFTSALESKVASTSANLLVGDLKGSLEALSALLDSLLDVSRLDAGVVTPEIANVSLAVILERLIANITPQAAAKGVALKLVPTSAIIRTDAMLFGRIIQNLISNAVKYTNRGRILVGCRHQGESIRVEVWDTGIGIPKDQHDEIFQEFYQIGNYERDRAQGLGLGLAIVQRLSRLLNCRVTLRSVEGKGSVFTVTVPLVGHNKTKNIAYMPYLPNGERRDGRPIVLVIDDEAAVLRSLRVVIEDWGYDVLTATGEDEALAQLAQQARAPDLIVADYRLRAGRNGAEAVRHIRRIFDRAIPAIIITGDTAPERIREARTHGLDILHKPVQPAALKAVIADAVK